MILEKDKSWTMQTESEQETLLREIKKANGTRRASQAVPHPSTDRALRRLTSEFGWDRVCSTQYGRWRRNQPAEWQERVVLLAASSDSQKLHWRSRTRCAKQSCSI